MYFYGINFKTIQGASGFSFSDTDAEAFYDAMATENGGDIDSSTLFGIDLDTYKGLIDTFFTDLKADSTYSKTTHLWPKIGGANAPNLVCAIDAASEGSYVGSPSSVAAGVDFDGSTQYFDAGNDPSADVAASSNSLMIWCDTADTQFGAGSRDSSAESFLLLQNGSSLLTDNTDAATRYTISNSTLDEVIIISRVSNTDQQFYIDGTSQGTDTTFDTFVMPTASSFYGSWNNNGTPAAYLDGVLKACSIGQGYTASEAATLTTAIKDLKTGLGV